MSKNAWQTLGLATLSAVVLAGVVALLASWPPQAPRTAATSVTQVTPAAPAPQPPVVLVMGDSFSAGTGLDDAHQAFPWRLANRRGWELALDATSGTGYVNPGNTGPGVTEATGVVYAKRVPHHANVDAVLFTGGYNDYWSVETGRVKLSDFRPAVDRTLDAAEKAMPGAKLMVSGVWWPKPGAVPATVDALNSGLRAAAKAHDAVFVTGSYFHRADLGRIIGPDDTHPSLAGQRLIAQQLDERLPNVS